MVLKKMIEFSIDNLIKNINSEMWSITFTQDPIDLDKYTFDEPRFDPQSGEQTTPITQTVFKSDLNLIKEDLDSSKDNVEALKDLLE